MPCQKWSKYYNFDFTIYLLIVALGAIQFALVRRAPDYLNDTNYFELFKSLANHTGYGFNGKPMTQLPPGLPNLMAWLSPIIGSSYITMLRMMTVFTTLGLAVSYALLRSQQGRGVAAIACLLLGSSPLLFAFSTSLVFADMPYFFASTFLLLVAIRLDGARGRRPGQTLLWLLWGVVLVATMFLKSAGIALLGGLCCWMAVSYFRDREQGKRRIGLFLAFVMLAAAAEVGWMAWAARHQFHEWSIPGYQENYVAQLRLKNANDPELGLATWRDVVIRPVTTADDISASMVGLFAHKQMAPAWYSPGTLIPLVLILLGLASSFREKGGGLLEWYFVIYQMMFLFWPWEFELRFLFPVAPLAFLYGWRGASLLWRMAQNRPGLLGALGLSLAAAGGWSSIAWGQHVLHPQLQWCVTVWLLVAASSIALLVFRRDGIQRLALRIEQPSLVGGWALTRWQLVGAIVVVCLCVAGVTAQLKIGHANLDTAYAKDDFNYPEIDAAEWIKAHSGPSSVVMARKDDMIYHYSQRRVIWFPPSRDAAKLMEGIRRYHVQFVVVHYGADTYWRPPAEDCFEALSKAYPSAFHLVHAGPHSAVFEVSPPASPKLTSNLHAIGSAF